MTIKNKTRQQGRPGTVALMLLVFGPGLVVMFADTDAGSIIVAAQSGAQWGYKLLLLQFLLMPILFIAQELAVRLGVVTGKGHGELIKKQFGKKWAWLSVSTLIVSCIGAMFSEFSGLAGVGNLFGISTGVVMILVVTFLSVVALTGSYRSVERIALLFGLFVVWIVNLIRHYTVLEWGWLLIASLPIVGVGILEDITKKNLRFRTFLNIFTYSSGYN